MRAEDVAPLGYHLCPRCFRAVPAEAREDYCPNDGTKLLAACPRCQGAITLPHARYCMACGYTFEERKPA